MGAFFLKKWHIEYLSLMEENPRNSFVTIYLWSGEQYNIRVPQAPILGPLLFIIYINDLSPTIHTLSKPIIFDDDKRVIISTKMFDEFCRISNMVLCHVIKWFSANRLSLNPDKTNLLRIIPHSMF
jgi:hypothetical protein